MKHHLPASLDDLRAFETVARYSSVRQAADELALTHGAVSRRVAKLSKSIGVPLLERDGRGIRITAGGKRLAQATTEGFTIIARALKELRAGGGGKPVVLSCERSVALRWLIPRLGTFQTANPHLSVHLSVGGGTLDLDKDGVTLAIRRLDFPIDPGWTVEELMEESVGPVMRPDMVERFRSGDYVALGSKTRPEAWQDWLGRNPEAPRPSGRRDMDHHFLALAAAEGGLGVAMCPKVLAVDDLAQSKLLGPLGFSRDGTRYGLIHTGETSRLEQINSLIDWLRSAAEQID